MYSDVLPQFRGLPAMYVTMDTLYFLHILIHNHYTPAVRLSFLFSVTVDGRNLIFGHARHICMPYCGKRFWTRQIPTFCLNIYAGVS